MIGGVVVMLAVGPIVNPAQTESSPVIVVCRYYRKMGNNTKGEFLGVL